MPNQMHNQGYRMEQIAQISASSSRGKQSHHTFDGSSIRPLGVLLLICLLAPLAQVSARPSDAAKPVVTVSSSDRADPAPISHRNLKRRSTDEHDYGDYFDEEYLHVRRCYEDEDVNELCQRCSKVTKSAIVFPMCCSNEDETMDWCKAYVYYGIQN